MLRPHTKHLLLAGAAAALAIPAIAQVANSVAPANTAQPSPAATAAQPSDSGGDTQTEVVTGSDASAIEQQQQQQQAAPAVEYPAFARRDPFTAGALDPIRIGLGANAWGGANGGFLSSLLRRTDTPLASRWLHIALRDALLAKAHAPGGVNPVDWAAERAWLLLRMGEADAARMVVDSVDTDKFTPKMVQVAVQTDLATSDPAGLCPIADQIQKVESTAYPLVQAMCSALGGDQQTAGSQLDAARRHGIVGGIDLDLAQKVVGAAGESGRAATIQWDPVDSLTAWRYGLSTATAMNPPDRLINAASLQLRAWYARAPMIPYSARLNAARIATGLGVFSSQALVDFYSQIYDATDPNDLGSSDAWQVRLAFAGRDNDTRLVAMRHLWGDGKDLLQIEASRALLAGAAARIAPDPKLAADAPELIASMLAGGLDRDAARWNSAVQRMDDKSADRCWAMLALASPNSIDLGRLGGFIDRDDSPNKKRSQLLVAGLAALGRIDLATASRLNSRYGLHLERTSNWTAMIDAAADREQPATVLVLAGTGFQTGSWSDVPSAHLFHAVAALRKTGQDYTARMIAAEALART
jgi:hypothetical protein